MLSTKYELIDGNPDFVIEDYDNFLFIKMFPVYKNNVPCF